MGSTVEHPHSSRTTRNSLARVPLRFEAAAALEYRPSGAAANRRRLDQQTPPAVALSAERARAAPASSLFSWTRTTRLAARSGRLHRPGDPRAGPRDADVTGRATASVRHRTAASRGETNGRTTPTRPCPGTIASITAASSCRLCLCHECTRPAPAGPDERNRDNGNSADRTRTVGARAHHLPVQGDSPSRPRSLDLAPAGLPRPATPGPLTPGARRSPAPYGTSAPASSLAR